MLLLTGKNVVATTLAPVWTVIVGGMLWQWNPWLPMGYTPTPATTPQCLTLYLPIPHTMLIIRAIPLSWMTLHGMELLI